MTKPKAKLKTKRTGENPPKMDARQTALSVVEQAIVGKLSNDKSKSAKR